MKHVLAAEKGVSIFRDTIHGHFALAQLPKSFQPTLKAVLSSSAMARLRRVSQLGYTSLNHLSATHTRFSHAIGTMLVLHRLFEHLDSQKAFSDAFLLPVIAAYEDKISAFSDAKNFIHCHLLLAALYQDAGELPFHVTSSFFRSSEVDLAYVKNLIRGVTPEKWQIKPLLSVLSFLKDCENPLFRRDLKQYDQELICFLITGHGFREREPAFKVLNKMLDGVIDADRIDYVFRDAAMTIGSSGQPGDVIESIRAYKRDIVVVSDASVIAQFLSLRIRLWTEVYMAPDVRFRRVLLRTVLDGRFDNSQSMAAYDEARLYPTLAYEDFIKLGDKDVIDRLEALDRKCLTPLRRKALGLLVEDSLDYSWEEIRRTKEEYMPSVTRELPNDLFFDLRLDARDIRLYKVGTVQVRGGDRKRALRKVSAKSREFNTDMKDSVIIFNPRDAEGNRWQDVRESKARGEIVPWLLYQNARRSLACPSDTRNVFGYGERDIGISYCTEDFPTATRVVQEIYLKKHPYNILLYPVDGIGGSASENSVHLVEEAKAILVLASCEYLKRAMTVNSNIQLEVLAIKKRLKRVPISVLGLDSRKELAFAGTREKWKWSNLGKDQKEPIALT